MKFLLTFFLIINIIFSSIIFADKADPQSLIITKINNAIKNKKYEEAESSLKDVIKNSANYGINNYYLPHLRSKLGEVLYHQDKFNEADAIFTKLEKNNRDYIENNPNIRNLINENRTAMRITGSKPEIIEIEKIKDKIQKDIRNGDFESAEEQCKMLMQDNKYRNAYHDAKVWFLWAEALFYLKKCDSAWDAITQAERIDSKLSNDPKFLELGLRIKKCYEGIEQTVTLEQEDSSMGINIIIFVGILTLIVVMGFLINKLRVGGFRRESIESYSDLQISLSELNEAIDRKRNEMTDAKNPILEDKIEEAIDIYTNLSMQFERLKNGSKDVKADDIRNMIDHAMSVISEK